MQLVIDIAAETPAALRLAASFLLDHATLREAMDDGAGLPPANVEVPPAPFAPPPPSAPAAPAHIMAPPPPPVPLPPIPPVTSVAAVVPLPPVIVPAVDEFDASGVPWDARIHQKLKSVKKDKTWKLQKGIDQSLVEAVMRELAPRIRHGAATPNPAGASAPVSLPPLPSPGAPPAPPAPAQIEVPPAPPAEAPAAIDPFRALVAKITKARGAGRITPEEVVQTCAAAGVPSLQLLNNMPHLIPAVESGIDAILVMR